MKKTTPTRRVSVTLKPEMAKELQAFIESRNSGEFEAYRCYDPTDVSSMVKLAVFRFLRDVKKAQDGLVNQGLSLEESIESFWRNKLFWEQNSERQDVEPGTHAGIINIMEALK